MSNSIRFFFNEISTTPDWKEEEFKQWITSCIDELSDFKIDCLSFIFCKDEFLLSLNQDYLKHDTFTDIITFNYNSKSHLNGEIYISLDRIKENSNSFKVNFKEELKRVIIHGVLHLIGFDDKSKADKASMRNQEDYCLTLWPEK